MAILFWMRARSPLTAPGTPARPPNTKGSNENVKRIALVPVLASVLVVACGGDGDGGANVVIPAADANSVAYAGLPALEDLPDNDWLVVAQDEFESGSSDDFAEFIEGNPDCAALEDLAALQNVFGSEEEEEPAGRAQVKFEQQDPDAFIPTSVEVEIEVDESAAGSRAEFALVKGLFESDETSRCLISALNNQFAQSGQSGLEIEVTEGSSSASAPQDGARTAFDVRLSFAGIDLDMAMQIYFWAYGNANVQALFVGTRDTLNADLVRGVLEAVDENLKAAAGE
jgi:hypothetical protein